jgi:hypothetical protein
LTRGQVTCLVDVVPDVVDAGAEMTLQGSVSCAPACDLRGHTLLIKDKAGAAAGTVELTHFDGETNETDEFVVKAPVKPGTYTWSAVCPAAVKKGVSYTEAITAISFAVKAHTTSVVAWDIPSAVVAGERFTTKVGIKCSSECALKNTKFGIYDHKQTHVATAMLFGDRWPGTTGLYFAEVELEAPAEEGIYLWSVKWTGSDTGIPHDEGSVDFGVRVVGRPECVVTIETVDKESQPPLSGARVVMHPYRTVTDERGIAEVRVVKGAYTVFVSQTRYMTFGLPVEVTADVTARAELDLEPVTERN